jgi:hypothetical protein
MFYCNGGGMVLLLLLLLLFFFVVGKKENYLAHLFDIKIFKNILNMDV